MANYYQLANVSIPALATGIHKYPVEFTAQAVLPYLAANLKNHPHIKNLLLVNAKMNTALAYKEAASKLAASDVEIVDLVPVID